MKLQIKTLQQKIVMVDIEETKTVYDLKKELSLYADVGVEPELQKIIYNGKILNNKDQLSTYKIDVKKYLVIMILKQPSEEPPSMNVAEEQQNIQDIPVSSNTSPADAPKVKSAECVKAEDNGISSAEQGSDIDDMIKRITSMGFSEVEVRQALKACSNNPEQAIDHLLCSKAPPNCGLQIDEVIDVRAAHPINPLAPPNYGLQIDQVIDVRAAHPINPLAPPNYGLQIDEVIDVRSAHSINPLEFCHQDAAFNNIRQAVFQNPELLNAGIQQIAETNPALLNLVDENQEDFLAMLMEDMNGESDDDNEAEDGDEE